MSKKRIKLNSLQDFKTYKEKELKLSKPRKAK